MEILIGVLSVSIIANVALSVVLVRRKSKQLTYDARMLLHDLARGAAVIKVERVEPTDIFIRRMN